jgi:antitoxin VapB
MGKYVALSIRNHRAEKLARQVTAESGESLTESIIRALEERIERLKGRLNTLDVAEEIMKISLRCRALPAMDERGADEILDYDVRGIPR